MTVEDAIAAAEKLLPGQAAPDGAVDPRWQAIMKIEDFIPQEPEAIWPFVLKWGSHKDDDDLSAAIATVLLEHLLEYHFDPLFPRIEIAAKSNVWFGKTTTLCWKLGQAKEPTRAARFDRLLSEIPKK